MSPVLVAGHLCLELFPSHANRFEIVAGRMVEAGPMSIGTGGAVSNVGRGLQTLGIDVRLAGMVGDDPFGHLVLKTLGELGEQIQVRPGVATGYSVLLPVDGTERMVIHSPGCNDLFEADDIPDSAFEGVSIVHFGYPPLMAKMYADDGEHLVRLLRRAKDLAPIVSLDLSLPDPDSPSGHANWPTILAEALPHVDVFLPSVEELMFCLDRPMYDALHGASLGHLPPGMVESLADRALALGPKAVGIKVGERGFLLKTNYGAENLGRGWGDICIWHPCFQVDVAAKTGSGDATIAGFLRALNAGVGPLEACRSAVAVGACGVEAVDAVSGIRSWEETLARIDAGWPSLHVALPPEWKSHGSGFAKG